MQVGRLHAIGAATHSALGWSHPPWDAQSPHKHDLSLGRRDLREALFFSGSGAHARRMPRYSFSVVYRIERNLGVTGNASPN